MNITNSTSTNTIEQFAQYLVLVSRFILLFTGISYFVYVSSFKKLRVISYFPMHHVNFIGVIQGIILVSWSFSIYPEFNSQVLNEVLCYLSEILWGSLKNARAYSVLILALNRYLAVFKANIYKKYSKSFKMFFLSALFVWTVPILLYFSTKYATNSTHGLFCRDGFNTNPSLFITYFAVTSLLGFILPTLVVTSIYVLVTRELKKRRNRLGVNHNERTSQNQSMSKNNKKQRQLALQIITINSLEVFSFILIVNLGILQAYQEIFENINFIPYILIVGSINSFFITAVPIVTMIFLKSI